MLTDGHIELLREIAEIHLGYLEMQANEASEIELAGLQTSEVIEEAVLELMMSVRKDELDNPDFVSPFERLISELAEISGREDDVISRLLFVELDAFVVRCGQYPGPEVDFGPMRAGWDVSFDERYFKDMVSEIDRQLTSGLLDRVIVKIGAVGFDFDSSFQVDEELRYASERNQFILTCREAFSLEKDTDEVRKTFQRLSAALKLIYGLQLGLSRMRAIIGSQDGYKETDIGTIDAKYAGSRYSKKMNPELLIRYWPVLSERMKTAEKSAQVLLLRLRELDLTRETDDQIIDMMTCFEAIFSDGMEIRFRLASRAATFLGLMGLWGSYSVILQAYKYRSEIVHGAGGPTEDEISRLKGLIDKLHAYLRAVMLARLFFSDGKQVFLSRLDIVLKQLLDSGDVSESENTIIREFKQQVSQFVQVGTGTSVPSI